MRFAAAARELFRGANFCRPRRYRGARPRQSRQASTLIPRAADRRPAVGRFFPQEIRALRTLTSSVPPLVLCVRSSRPSLGLASKRQRLADGRAVEAGGLGAHTTTDLGSRFCAMPTHTNRAATTRSRRAGALSHAEERSALRIFITRYKRRSIYVNPRVASFLGSRRSFELVGGTHRLKSTRRSGILVKAGARAGRDLARPSSFRVPTRRKGLSYARASSSRDSSITTPSRDPGARAYTPRQHDSSRGFVLQPTARVPSAPARPRPASRTRPHPLSLSAREPRIADLSRYPRSSRRASPRSIGASRRRGEPRFLSRRVPRGVSARGRAARGRA